MRVTVITAHLFVIEIRKSESSDASSIAQDDLLGTVSELFAPDKQSNMPDWWLNYSSLPVTNLYTLTKHD